MTDHIFKVCKTCGDVVAKEPRPKGLDIYDIVYDPITGHGTLRGYCKRCVDVAIDSIIVELDGMEKKQA